MKKTIPLTDIVKSTIEGLHVEAENAPTEEVKASLLRCAEAAARLGEKLAILQTTHHNASLVVAMTKLPEHQQLVRERNLRFMLTKGGKSNG